MNALRDIFKLLLVTAGLIVAVYLIYKFWWIVIFSILLIKILLIIKYIVDGRFRE